MMKPETRSLIHKEWRQWRTPLAVCSGWILCCVFYVVAYECTRQFRAPVAAFSAASLLYTLLAAIFLGMKTALGEQTQGTLGFSLSLPVSRRRLAWTRLAGGALTLALPVVVGAVVMTPILFSGIIEQAQVRPPSGAYVSMLKRPSLSAAEAAGLLWTVTAIAVANGVQFLLILSIFGARRRSESHVGFFGAVLAFAWLVLPGLRIVFEGVNGWLGALLPGSLVIHWGYGGEGGSYSDLDLGRPLWVPLAVNLLVLLLLAEWFARRYGTRLLSRRSRPALRWRRWPALWSRIPVPLPGRAAALVWINLRQSLPVAVSGLMLAALLTLAQFSVYERGQTFRSQLPSSTWFVAAVWATVVGVGIFAAELRPGLSDFWRSRPIHVGSWFWCKFLTGLIAVLVVLDGVTIWVSWGTRIGSTTGMSWSYIACMPIFHATLYAMAVLAVCLTRRPVAGGLLAVGAYFAASTLLDSIIGQAFEPISVHNSLLRNEIAGQFNLTGHNYPLVYGTLAAIVVTSAWLASRAIRRSERPSLLSRRRS
jgi:hypothetical protein